MNNPLRDRALRVLKLACLSIIAGAGSWALGEGVPKPRLAATPPMGWNSWEAFRREFDEDVIKAQADAMVAQGLKDAGYEYLVIDGGWKPGTRGPGDVLIEDPRKFPHGMKAVADYVHSKGLKFGLHQPAGIHDCPRLSPGSQGHEEADAKVLTGWGIDFIKYDRCDYVHAKGTTTGSPDFDRFVVKQGDKVVFETEAEAQQNKITGLARVELRDGCSGGRVVAGVGFEAGAITIPDVLAPAAGKYVIDVQFAYPYFGMEQYRSMTFFVSANGAEPNRVELPYDQAKRYTFGTTSVEVELKAGRNEVVFSNGPSQEEEQRQSYLKMSQALFAGTARPLMFSMCGTPRPWLWAQPIAHLYRCEGDITDRWEGQGHTVMWVLDRHIPLLDRTARGSWADPDMLEVGRKGAVGRPRAHEPAMTDAQYRAQFSLWCVFGAPLFISMDLREIDASVKRILLNKDVIAVDQDTLASPCKCVRQAGDVQVFVRRLADGDAAVVFLNRSKTPVDTSATAGELGLSDVSEARDLWTGTVQKPEGGVVNARVEPQAVVMLRLQGPRPDAK